MSKDEIKARGKLSPDEAKRHVDSIIRDFKDHYSSLGYHEEPSVLISSGVDPSVRFIGSPISVLKPYLVEDRVPSPGLFLHQDCIRTKNLGNYLDDSFIPDWGSYFPNMGAITIPKRFGDGCNEVFDFFEDRLKVSPDDILIRISSADKDLLGACLKRYNSKNLEIDGKDQGYYRHTIGVPGIEGRNCNIALRNSKGGGFYDVANLISIENAKTQLCLEMSIGTTTILKEIHGLDHVLDCTPVADLESVDERFRRKLEDSIITSTVLFHEGLRPKGKNNRTRILKKYLQAMSYFRAKCRISLDELTDAIYKFEEVQLPGVKHLAGDIIDFMKIFEEELLVSDELIPTQLKIKYALLKLNRSSKKIFN